MDTLLVIDYQNDFVSPKGKVAKGIGNSTLEKSQRLHENIQKLIDVWHTGGKQIIFIMSDYSTDIYTETFRKHREKSPYGNTAKKGTWGHELYKIQANKEDCFIIKHFFSGFQNTELLDVLQGSKNVFICGINTNVCLFHTAIDAAINGFETYVIEDATETSNDDKKPFLRNLVETVGVHIVSTEMLTR